jgi:putative PIN family toxin of toxin-antitoxin system
VRIVFDTNVIVAAFASRGLCAEVFEVCITGHTLVISESILDEIHRSLLKKLKLPKHFIREVIEYLRDVSEIVEPDLINRSVCRDKDDLPVIGTATKGKAACIVTGDSDLLSVKNYRGIDIITPRQFWERLR